jgi:2-polyprenyl-3-methyl-5-hydroxy-6-metoxy-1,4-benzoquinol methylase
MVLFNSFINHSNPDSFVNSLRKKRFRRIREIIEELIAERGSVKVLDIGGEIAYWRNMGWQNNAATIYLLNLDPVDYKEQQEGYIQVQGNALKLPYEMGEFDLVFSNSVIEHVGSEANQKIFANEVRRISSNYIIQTPSFWFPLEPHSMIPFFQFIPHSIRAVLIMVFNINYFPKTKSYQEAIKVSKNTLMLTRSGFQKLFPEAAIEVEYLYGIPKSYSVYWINK